MESLTKIKMRLDRICISFLVLLFMYLACILIAILYNRVYVLNCLSLPALAMNNDDVDSYVYQIIRQVSCGAVHVVVLSEDGLLQAWGNVNSLLLE